MKALRFLLGKGCFGALERAFCPEKRVLRGGCRSRFSGTYRHGHGETAFAGSVSALFPQRALLAADEPFANQAIRLRDAAQARSRSGSSPPGCFIISTKSTFWPAVQAGATFRNWTVRRKPAHQIVGPVWAARGSGRPRMPQCGVERTCILREGSKSRSGIFGQLDK